MNKPNIEAGFIHLDNFAEMSQLNLKDYDLDEFPILPTRNLVLFPGVASPVKIGRQTSLATVKAAERSGHPIAIICQKDPDEETPGIDGLYSVGVVAKVIKVIDFPDGTTTALVVAHIKCELLGPSAESSFNPEGPLLGRIRKTREFAPTSADSEAEFATYGSEIKALTLKLTENSPAEQTMEMTMNLQHAEAPEEIVNIVSTHFPAETEVKIALLKENSLKTRARKLLTELIKHEEMLEIAKKVHDTARESFNDQQRRAFLQRQMEAIDKELNGDDSDIEDLRARAEKTAMPDDVKATFEKELAKLGRNNPQSPDYAVQYSFLETLLELPWGITTEPQTSLANASEILESEHYGLRKVKDRIVEQVALMINNPNGKAPILCLVGPPGVGKTSLGKSVAESLGRKFQRISLGGLHDESEIRGHRRTYIGAMPGRIIEAIKRAGTINPVIMLDEIDKIGKDYKGDPESALLEVLDPEQNCRFHDNYIDIDFDLSKVLFIATANNASAISRPLLDRMETIDLSGYIVEEKIQIARRHLLPKIIKDTNVNPESVDFTDGGLSFLIERYTAESGVRQLEKELYSIARKAIVRALTDKPAISTIGANEVEQYLGKPRFTPEHAATNTYPGVVTGLAWTAAGGEILFIETSVSKAKAAKLTLTGNLGDVMKESAMIALQYVRANAATLGIESFDFDETNIHIHVPEGAIPKDGPSAGITMATSILSAISGKRVNDGVAMTGELTLRGKVMPVGGIKEKILAAKRSGINKIILCHENRKDVEEIEEGLLNGVEFTYITDVQEVFENVFE